MSGNEKRSLYELFGKLNWKLHRHHMMNHAQRGPMAGPHRGQGRVLVLLSMRDEISQRDLLYLLDMRPQSLGELLAKLERGGYIVRTPSEADKRVMMVRLTEAGKQAASDIERAEPDRVFDCLNDDERESLTGYLTRINNSLDAQYGDEEQRFDFHEHGRRHGHFSCGRGDMGGRPDFERGRSGCGRRDGHTGFDPDGMRRDGRFTQLGRDGCEHPNHPTRSSEHPEV